MFFGWGRKKNLRVLIDMRILYYKRKYLKSRQKWLIWHSLIIDFYYFDSENMKDCILKTASQKTWIMESTLNSFRCESHAIKIVKIPQWQQKKNYYRRKSHKTIIINSNILFHSHSFDCYCYAIQMFASLAQVKMRSTSLFQFE